MKQSVDFSKGATLFPHLLKNQWKLLVLIIFIFNIQYQNCQGQTATPIALASSSFNFDCVAESSPPSSSTTGSMPGGDVIYSTIYPGASGTGMPATNTFSNSDVSYDLQPYTGNNALEVSGSNDMTFQTSTAYTKLHFAGMSVNGTNDISITVTFTDNTTEQLTSSYTVQDWFGGSGTIHTLNGRAEYGNGNIYNQNSGNPRVYSFSFDISAANQAKMISKVTITDVGGSGTAYIFAMAGGGTMINNALDFDGSNDYVEVNNSFDFHTGDFTVEVWFKGADVSNNGQASSIFCLIDENKTNESSLYLGLNFNGFGHADNGKLRVNHRAGYDFIGGENFLGTTPLDDNLWHHVTLTRASDGFLRLYIDGTLNATSSNTVGTITAAKDGLIQIGRNAPNAPRLFNGELDEVRVWSTALSVSDVADLYNKTFNTPLTSTCLEAYYKFDETTGFVASNSSSQNTPSRAASLYNMDNSDWVASGHGAIASGLSGCSTLPVELTSFIGKVGEDNVSADLVWQTATEKNNEGFEVEHSADGHEWQNISFIAGQGTTQEVQNYIFTDDAPLAKTNYYRLKQIDFDGQFEYSSVVSVVFEASEAEQPRLFPNPVKNDLNIINAQGVARIFNILGQPVKQFIIAETPFIISVGDLSEGQYILQIIKENGSISSQSFVK